MSRLEQTYCTQQEITETAIVISYSIWRLGRRHPLFDVVLPHDPDLPPEIIVHAKTSQIQLGERATRHVLSHR